MRANTHYVTSFKFLGSAVASRKMLDHVLYIWAASLVDSSRCRHNLFILIFACMFCEKGKRIREASREKCISS